MFNTEMNNIPPTEGGGRGGSGDEPQQADVNALKRNIHEGLERKARAVREAARRYLKRGWMPIPIPHKGKGPKDKGWQELRLTEETLEQHFPSGNPVNVGLLLGEPSGGLVDVDLDCEEAVDVAPLLLPPTDMIHGRMSRPRSHYWFVVEEPPAKATTKFTDLKGESLVELRSTGGQTVVPPSIHPEGEPIRWEQEGEPARVDAAELLRAVKRVAAAALLARHWADEGSRQDAAMALAGGLLRLEWSEDEVETFIQAVARAAGDEEDDKRTHPVSHTREKLQGGQKVTGWRRLAKLLVEDGMEVVNEVMRLLTEKGRSKRAALGSPQPEPGAENAERTNQATMLVELFQDSGGELFHDEDNTPYAALEVNGHREVWRLEAATFKRWLARLFYERHGKALGSQTVEDAVKTLGGQALYDGEQKQVHLRLASHNGKIYLDLADPAWRAVEIDAGGWRFVDRPPALFRRHAGMKPLTAPVHGGSAEELGRFLNLGDEQGSRLILGWLVGALNPKGPYPVLVLHGEQGSGKTTTARGLRSLIDPHSTLLRAAPGNAQDLAIAARNNLVLAYDNLSDVKPWLSDSLSRMSTREGFATRKLYTDDEESFINVSRPVLLNGIAPEMIHRPDLLDRALLVELPSIEGQRRTEAEVCKELEEARPRILGALLDAVSMGLRRRGSVHLDHLPRMADFAYWAEACGPAFEWKQGEFAQAMLDLRGKLDEQALSLWPVYPALQTLLERDGTFQGTVGQLLEILIGPRLKPEGAADWPKTAKALGTELRRYAPNLHRDGIKVQFLGKTREGSGILIQPIGGGASAKAM
jgi:hypothetical protein